MPIPEDQLTTWAKQGAVTASSRTYASVQQALDSYTFPPRANYGVYLQGSYKNDTNIRGDSDVDIIVELRSTFQADITKLSPHEKSAYAALPDATYHLSNFKSDVYSALSRYYGSHNIALGGKAITVKKDSVPLNADIIVALHYKNLTTFTSLSSHQGKEGITFYVQSENRWIVNYPLVHYAHGVYKNSGPCTNGWFKPAVRLFKNARGYMVDAGIIQDSLAPSYFVECLVYNVPHDRFGTSYQHTYYNVCQWLQTARISTFLRQHEQAPLCSAFGFGSDEWSLVSAQTFVDKLAYLWDHW